jgi:hypothetical protein
LSIAVNHAEPVFRKKRRYFCFCQNAHDSIMPPTVKRRNVIHISSFPNLKT